MPVCKGLIAGILGIFVGLSTNAGTALGDSVGGSVTKVTPFKVVCRNRTTRKSVVIKDGAPSWDCELAGLQAHPGDIVIMTLYGTVEDDASDPIIEFTSIPPRFSSANLFGRVVNVDPTQFKIAVFIRVRGGYWTKPYWSIRLTNIRSDGTWECDVTTGGVDPEADLLVAYLVPNGYNPPLMSGQTILPAELDQNSIAKVQVLRP